MKKRAFVITLLGCLMANFSFSQGTPTALRPDIIVEHYLDVAASTTRMAYDPVTDQLYYITYNGDVYSITDTGTPVDALEYTATDHGIASTLGIAFLDSSMFLVGNIWANEDATGMIVRGKLESNGTRTWSNVATTEVYGGGGKLHGFNAIAVSPDGNHLYINSGSRSDHGEIQDMGGLLPNMREDDITAIILKIPSNSTNLLLLNDSVSLSNSGYLYAAGVRNTFDLAFDQNGNLFGAENSGDRDDPEELNWIRQGHHYGFPWMAGDNQNGQQFPGYIPANDLLINPNCSAAQQGWFYDDPTFPPAPSTAFTAPIRNLGPDADKYRDAVTGGIMDAGDQSIELGTFTTHRSPLGLVFDNGNYMDTDFVGDGFITSFTPGGDSAGFSPISPWGLPVVPVDPSEDLLHLEFTYDTPSDNYKIQSTRIVEGFYLPVDAEVVQNVIYVVENWGGTQRSMWKITMPPSQVSVEEVDMINLFGLTCFPTPSNETAFINYQLPKAGDVTFEVLGMNGQIVRQLDKGKQSAGEHQFLITTANMAAGMYFYRITVEGIQQTGKLVVTH
jgi:hypothetical protein